MTYGVYSKDLKYSHITGLYDVATARRYLYQDTVICSEKEIKTSFRIELYFHKWRKWRVNKLDDIKVFGFISLSWKWCSYTWSDKIIEEYKDKEHHQLKSPCGLGAIPITAT